MGDSVGVDVMKSPDELLSDFPDLLNLQALVVFDYVEKLSLTQLSYKNELALSLKRIKQ